MFSAAQRIVVIPFLGLFIEIGVILLAIWATRMSRNNGLDLSNENLANIARIIAWVFLVLWAIGLLLALLR